MLFIDVAMKASSAEVLAELLPTIRQVTADTNREKGCLIYRFTIDVNDPCILRVTELWQSQEALNAHFAGEAVKALKTILPRLERLGVRAYEGALEEYDLPLPADIADR